VLRLAGVFEERLTRESRASICGRDRTGRVGVVERDLKRANFFTCVGSAVSSARAAPAVNRNNDASRPTRGTSPGVR
jgi:hypothetical protein